MCLTKIEYISEIDSNTTQDVVALVTGNGSGTKLFQALLDNHEQICMIPAYPLIYFYPHWATWKEELKNNWNWDGLIDMFCLKHASVLDSRKIPGNNGMTTLGDDQDEYIKINEVHFRNTLKVILANKSINSKTFILAVHHAYSLCVNEDLQSKKCILYHIHSPEYLTRYLVRDYPNTKVICMLRDPRSSIIRRYKSSFINVDDTKLNKTDALLYRKRAYFHSCQYILDALIPLRSIYPNNLRAVRHEDLICKLEDTMKSVSGFIDIDFSPSMLEITFGGKDWWGDTIYEMQPMNVPNPRVVSQEWQEKFSFIDWFVIEGLLYDYLDKYEYPIYRYKNDSFWNRVLLIFAILIPTQIEWKVLFHNYLTPKIHFEYFRSCVEECRNGFSTQSALVLELQILVILYKWTYIDLRLWETPWHVKLLLLGEKMSEDTVWSSIGQSILLFCQIIYVLTSYIRFFWAAITYPYIVLKRYKIFYGCFFRRIRNRNFLPELV